MGTNKYNPDVKYVQPPTQEKVLGIIGQNKLSQGGAVKELLAQRRARQSKFHEQDIKTFFTPEERARAFGGRIEPPKVVQPVE